MANSNDPFVGTWELDPETLEYEHGRPGRRATYVVEPKETKNSFSTSMPMMPMAS